MAPKKVQMAGTIFIWIFRIGIYGVRQKNAKNSETVAIHRHFVQFSMISFLKNVLIFTIS